jgi:hypothetical protein
MENREPVYLVMQANLNKTKSKSLKFTFDLKGSYEGRNVKDQDIKGSGTVLKDHNLIKN